MSRLSISLNVALLAAVVALAWTAYGRNTPPAVPGESIVDATASGEDTDRPRTSGDDQVALAVLDRLQRIDARLSALEQGGQGAHAAAAGGMRPQVRIDPRMAAEADRRVAVLFSDRDVDQQDWMRWQEALSELPPTEQLALGAAFARAVNSDRLKVRF